MKSLTVIMILVALSTMVILHVLLTPPLDSISLIALGTYLIGMTIAYCKINKILTQLRK